MSNPAEKPKGINPPSAPPEINVEKRPDSSQKARIEEGATAHTVPSADTKDQPATSEKSDTREKDKPSPESSEQESETLSEKETARDGLQGEIALQSEIVTKLLACEDGPADPEFTRLLSELDTSIGSLQDPTASFGDALELTTVEKARLKKRQGTMEGRLKRIRQLLEKGNPSDPELPEKVTKTLKKIRDVVRSSPFEEKEAEPLAGVEPSAEAEHQIPPEQNEEGATPSSEDTPRPHSENAKEDTESPQTNSDRLFQDLEKAILAHKGSFRRDMERKGKKVSEEYSPQEVVDFVRNHDGHVQTITKNPIATTKERTRNYIEDATGSFRAYPEVAKGLERFLLAVAKENGVDLSAPPAPTRGNEESESSSVPQLSDKVKALWGEMKEMLKDSYKIQHREENGRAKKMTSDAVRRLVGDSMEEAKRLASEHPDQVSAFITKISKSFDLHPELAEDIHKLLELVSGVSIPENTDVVPPASPPVSENPEEKKTETPVAMKPESEPAESAKGKKGEEGKKVAKKSPRVTAGKLSPEEKIGAVHTEVTRREDLLQAFVDRSPFENPNKILSAVITLVKELRISLSRQADVEKKDKRLKKVSESQKQYKKLGDYLEKITNERAGKGKIKDAPVYLKEVCTVLGIEVPVKKNTETVVAPPAPSLAVEAVPVTPPVGGVVVRSNEQSRIMNGSEGEATSDNPVFLEYLQSVEQATSEPLRHGDERQEQLLREAFSKRHEVATKFAQLYDGEMKRVLGVDASSPNLAQSIGAHIEALSLTNPERVIEHHARFAEAEATNQEITALEERRNRLAPEGEESRAIAELSEKQKILELAKASNEFWFGTGRVTGLFAMFGSEKLKARAEARKKVREMGLGSALGGIKHQEFTYWKGKSFEGGKVSAELAKIRLEIAGITAKNKPDTASVEADLVAKKRRLEEIKQGILTGGAMHDEVSSLVRNSVIEEFKKLLESPVAGQSTMREFERFDKAEGILAQIVASAEGGNDMFDSARDLGSPDEMRRKITDGAEALARNIIVRKLSETLHDPRSAARYTALQRELEELFSREKIGRWKGENSVRQFVLRELEKYIQEQETKGADSGTSPEDKKMIALRILVLRSLLAAERSRLRATPTPPATPPTTPRAPSHSSGGPSSPPSPPPPSPTPSSPPTRSVPPPSPETPRPAPEFAPTPPAPESTVSDEEMDKILEADYTLPAPEAPASPQPSPEGATLVSLTPEQSLALTFDDVMQLDHANLKRVVREAIEVGSVRFLAQAFLDQPEANVEKVRQCLTDVERGTFDGFLITIYNTAEFTAFKQRWFLGVAQSVLVEQAPETTTLPAEEPQTPPESEILPAEKSASAEIGGNEGISNPEIEYLTFEGLENLSHDELQEIVRESSVTPLGWGIAMVKMTSSFQEKMRACFPPSSTAFDRGLELKNTNEEIEFQRIIVEGAKKLLRKRWSEWEASKVSSPVTPEKPSSVPESASEGSGEETARKMEGLSTSERIGDAFVRFCKEGGPVYEVSDLLKRLKETLPNADVRRVFRPSAAQEVYFHDHGMGGSSQISLLVTIGSENYLLPAPSSALQFDTIAGFEYKQGSRLDPASLEHFTPAKVVRNEQRWDIQTPGLLNKQPQKETPSVPQPEGVETAKNAETPLTAEKIENLTFEGLEELSEEDLKEVIKEEKRVRTLGWGIALQGMPHSFFEKVLKGFSGISDEPLLGLTAGLEYKTDLMVVRNRKQILETARTVLKRKLEMKESIEKLKHSP